MAPIWISKNLLLENLIQPSSFFFFFFVDSALIFLLIFSGASVTKSRNGPEKNALRGRNSHVGVGLKIIRRTIRRETDGIADPGKRAHDKDIAHFGRKDFGD
jgi:hypothetical protein